MKPVGRTGTDIFKTLAIAAIVIVAATAMLWPFYRKFFINEWRERIGRGEPIVFIPDCPVVAPQFRCGDRYTLTYRRGDGDRWCVRVRKNEDPDAPEQCGIDIDAWDFARSWRYFTVDGVRVYYSWRGRALVSSPNRIAGWLETPETLAARSAHPLAME
jgi:hypothetical protein